MPLQQSFDAAPIDRVLILLHQPRTGGGATICVLEDEFGAERVFVLGRQGAGYPDFLNTARAEACRIYAGSFGFGVHQHLSASFDYVTTLRDPVDRVLSSYEASGRGAGLSLPEWLAESQEANNAMVRRLCGIGDVDGLPYDFVADEALPAEPELTPADLDQAIANIEQHVPLILIHGHFEENMLLLQQRYGTGPLFSLTRQRQNQSTVPVRRELYAPALIQEISVRNGLDTLLYQRCLDGYRRRLARQGPEFQEELRIMRQVAAIVGEKGTPNMTEEGVLQRLTTAINKLIRTGDERDAIKILGRFSRKRGISAQFCRNVLEFTRLQGDGDEIAAEASNYAKRFGTDAFLTEFAHDTGLDLQSLAPVATSQPA